MDLFSRRVLMTGPPADYMAWAVDMCTYVNDKIDDDVSLWAASMGAPAGTMVYSVWTDGLAGMQANTDTLIADPDYMAKVGAAQNMVAAPSEDSMAHVIHGERGDSAPIGAVATVTTAVIGNGAYAAAIGWGVEMAELAAKVIDLPAMLLMNAAGTVGQLMWVSVAPDAAAADAAFAAVNTNADYMAKMEDTGNLFVPGSGHRTIATRIA